MKHFFTGFFFIALMVGMKSADAPWYWYVCLVLLWLTIVGVGSGFISSQYHVKAHLGNPKEKHRKIALTFDDGPSEFTPKVLDILKEHQIPATFFCIGRNVKQFPEIAERIVSDGHLIGNHSFTHGKTFDLQGKHGMLRELKQTDAVIQEITGKKVRWFRPPYGVTTPSMANALKETEHEVIGWNIRSNDGISADVPKILGRIEKRLKPGGIILMHDTSASSVQVLEQLLLTLRRENFTVVPVSELLDLKAYED